MKVTDIKTKMHMQEWAKLIETRQDSGLSIKEWCRQNSLPESQYYYYLKSYAWQHVKLSLPKGRTEHNLPSFQGRHVLAIP